MANGTLQFIFISLIVILTFSIAPFYSTFFSFDPYAPKTTYTVGDGKTLKVGIMSDSQLIEKKDSTRYNYTAHLIRGFEVLKSHGVEAIIFDGDISDSGTEFAFTLFKNVFDQVYAGEIKPILNIVMGNHDYWADPNVPSYLQERFATFIGEKPFSHKVINGYHFVNWGSEDGSYDKCNSNRKWFQFQIEDSIKDDPTKPVFVTTHLPPSDTMYGSNPWGNSQLSFLSNYPQVVSISGHTHYALTDPRTIWQGTYTAFGTQSVSYTEMEVGKENGSIPKDEYGNDEIARSNNMGIIMTLTENKVELQRISLSKDKFYREPWIIDLPIDVNTFRYNTEKRKEESNPPVFIGETKIELIQQKIGETIFNQINFKQAVHEDLVHSYKIIFDNGINKTELLYFSDFYLLEEDRKEYITLKLPSSLSGPYDVSIIAIESFGKESEPIQGKIEIK